MTAARARVLYARTSHPRWEWRRIHPRGRDRDFPPAVNLTVDWDIDARVLRWGKCSIWSPVPSGRHESGTLTPVGAPEALVLPPRLVELLRWATDESLPWESGV